MKILFLCEISDPGVGSSTRLMYQQARALRVMGHETQAVSTVRDAGSAGPREIEGMLVHHLHSDYPVRFRAWKSLHNRAIDAPLQRLLEEWEPDVVHAHLVHTHIGYHALTQAARTGAAVVFTAHDVMTFCYQKLTCFHGGEEHGGTLNDIVARPGKCIPCQRLRFRPGRNARIREVIERDVQRLTVVSDALGEVLRANEVRVDRTVHNALELSAEPDPAAVAEFVRRHGLEDHRVIAIGGRLHSQKGVGKLLEMLAILADEFPDLRLLVMGKRDVYENEFRAQAEQLGVHSMVVSTGWLDGEELASAYSATDIFVTPSICFDTFGMVNLEAMEHAKPVVATSFGGSREVVLHGETGFIENPFDLQAFSGHMATLLRDPQLRLRMGLAGRERLLQSFGIERMAQEYLEEYQAATERAGGS